MQDTNHELSNTESTALVLLNTRNIGGYKSLKDMIKPNAEMPWGNHFAFLHISVPNLTKTEFSNPLDFVLKAHRLIVCLTARLLESLRKFKGPETTARYIHGILKNSSMAITNLIGPVEQMALANHPISGLYDNVAGAPQSFVPLSSLQPPAKIDIARDKEKQISLKLNQADETVISLRLDGGAGRLRQSFSNNGELCGKLRVSVGVEKGFIHRWKFKSSIENAFQKIFKAAVQSPSSPNSLQ
ncbi:hypothetical protein F0562_010785 [Nyssa sinensis]|uniref:O-acyltransferase WSD1 C-terminal domain-containing protein n=1 Tax=Nyssa sinensis TaxID=561372 RepID=A0A5J5A3I7_9ASTE|nr:hypothetical protein F0562_010785 [Nyssa sinensis]